MVPLIESAMPCAGVAAVLDGLFSFETLTVLSSNCDRLGVDADDLSGDPQSLQFISVRI